MIIHSIHRGAEGTSRQCSAYLCGSEDHAEQGGRWGGVESQELGLMFVVAKHITLWLSLDIDCY